ncbi:MAG TPA: redoxin family protein [Labilithrix sp.]|jgi:thiol-disulfide isomerase/thioredoxin
MTRRFLGALALASTLLVGHGRAEAFDSGPTGGMFATPPWIGVQMDATGGTGVGVVHVVRGSPADKGGMKAGDRIVVVDGTKVSAPGDVSRAVQAHRVGDTVSVEVERGGSSVKSQLVLASRPNGDEIMRMDLVGAFAPAWSNVTAPAGAPQSLASLKGRVVVMDFWASWCGPCKMLAPRLSALKDRLGAQGLTVVGVTTDDAQKAAEFAGKHDMRYPTVIDTNADTSKIYGVGALPTMIVVDKRGVIREVFVGFDPGGDVKLESLVKTLLAEPAPSP